MTVEQQFKALRLKDEKALVCFVMAGDPSLDQLPEILSCLQESGADIIEIGIPFSDPIADGPVIQAAGQRALDSGVTPMAVLSVLSQCKIEIPIVLMGYVNPVMRHGFRSFGELALGSGASGVILSDMIPDESSEWIITAQACGLDTIFLAAPTSTDERLKIACDATSGFVYAVSRTGVTGASTSLSGDAKGLVERLRKFTTLPICVGFGVSEPSQVREICQLADGAVIGSRLVTLLHEQWNNGAGKNEVARVVAEWKAATRP